MARAALAGMVVGAVGVERLHAQQPSARTSPAFYISEFEVHDPEGIKPYSARVESTFEPFGGRFLVRGGTIVPLEGEAPKGRIVVIAFDSMEKAQAWYDSPAYRELRPIRHGAFRLSCKLVSLGNAVGHLLNRMRRSRLSRRTKW